MEATTLLSRVRDFFRGHSLEKEMDDEMRFHLEMETEKNMSAGMTRQAARSKAVAAFGGVDRHQETMRDKRGGRWLQDVGRDVRYAARTLVRNPGFAAAAVLTLALAIGLNGVVFSLINGMVLRPFPVAQPNRLAAIWGVDPRDHGALHLAYGDYVEWRDRSGIFSTLAAQAPSALTLNVDGSAEIIWSELVTGNYFSTLGLKAHLGRFFVGGEEARAGAAPHVVISQDLWRRRFQSDPRVVGRKVQVNNQPMEVIGVAGADFKGLRRFGFWPDLWVPLGAPGTRNLLSGRGEGTLTLVGRLAPGIDLKVAGERAEQFAQGLSSAWPETNRGLGVLITSARSPFDSPRYVPPRMMTLAASLSLVGVALVLLIACANVANLLLARASAREREVAVRLSIGGSRGRIVRQLLTESALLALLGGVIGLAFAASTSRLQGSLVPQLQFRVGLNTAVDHRVILFTALTAFAAVFLFGLAPALQATRVNLIATLRNDVAGHKRRSRWPELRTMLVGAQIAMSVMLLVAGSLFLRSLGASRAIDFGFDPSNRFVISANPGANAFDSTRLAAFYDEVSRQVQALPGVVSAAWAYPVPFDTNDRGVELYVSGVTDGTERQTMAMPMSMVDRRYFETMGIPMVAGREFAIGDSLGAPNVIIVNRLAAERLWPGRDALGQRVRQGGAQGREMTVVGVAETSVYVMPTETPRAQVFFAARQHRPVGLTLVVRARDQALPVMTQVREAIRSVDPQVPTYGAMTMDRSIANALTTRASVARTAGTFAILALVLALIGLYGVVAYSVERRTREIGIRIALGAKPSSVIRLVLSHIARTTVIGVGIGLVGAVLIAQAVRTVLYGVSATDPLTFVTIPALLTIVALLSSYLPARRATRVDPMIALRRE
jgi:predicted permease